MRIPFGHASTCGPGPGPNSKATTTSVQMLTRHHSTYRPAYYFGLLLKRHFTKMPQINLRDYKALSCKNVELMRANLHTVLKDISGQGYSKSGKVGRYVLQPMDFICWIANYPLDKIICSLNNGGLMTVSDACIFQIFLYFDFYTLYLCTRNT